MRELLNLVLGGAVAGGLYAVLAVGVVLTYQTSGVFNIAHGATAFATAYLFFELHTGLGWPVPVAAAIAVAGFAPTLGWAFDRFLFRRLAGASDPVRLVVPLALLVAVPGFCLLVVDRANAWLDAGLPTHDQVLAVPGLGPNPKVIWRLNGVIVDSNQVAVLAVAVAAAVGLWVLLRRTRLGLHLRAVVDGRDLARLRGVDADRTSSVAWMLGSFLAGLAGVLLAPLFTLDPPSFTTIVLVSTPAVVLARFRSLPLALAGGLAIGVVGNLVIGYAGFARGVTGLRTALPFLLLFVLLFFRGPERTRPAATAGPSPAGAGRTVRSRGAAADRRTIATVAAVLAALGAVVLVADDHWQSLVARGLALTLVMLSFTVVTGLGGMVSLAQAMFATAAAFTAGWALSRGWPFGVALVAAAGVATAVGALVSVPARRLGGLALALSTMAAAFIAQYLVFPLDAVSHQSRSGWTVAPPALGPLDLADGRVLVVVLAALVAAAVAGVRNLTASATGRALAALQASEPAARAVGIAAPRLKSSVFALSAALAGVGGVFLATTTGSVSYVDFPVELGFVWLTAAVVFGIRRPAGAVLAGLAVALSPELLRVVSPGPLPASVLFGFAALALARHPDGLVGVAGRTRRPTTARPTDDDGDRATGTPVASPGTGPAPGDPTDPPALVLTGVRAGYGGATILRGVDLTVPRGTTVALVGPNGAGKSTLCRVVAGLLAPTDGRVVIAGRDATAEPAPRRVHGGTFLVPEGRGVFPALSVEENLALWLDRPELRAAAFDRFARLAERRDRPAGALSGGEQQLLALAPALVRPPALLLVDEPSLGLAPRLTEQVFAALAEIRAAGTTVLLVEEKVRDVLAVADLVALLDLGRVAWTAPADEVDGDRLARAYLDRRDDSPTGAAPAADCSLEGTTP